MAQFLQMTLGGVLGLGSIAGVFWFAFRRAPDAREPPHGSYSASDWASPDSGSTDGHSG